jgi:hypothetical protein
MGMSHHTEDVFPIVHHFVKLTKLTVFQVLVEFQTPLSSAKVHAKVVSWTWKVNPFWMTEFVAHEVQVAFTTETDTQ